jgi:hypothetical protein
MLQKENGQSPRAKSPRGTKERAHRPGESYSDVILRLAADGEPH